MTELKIETFARIRAAVDWFMRFAMNTIKANKATPEARFLIHELSTARYS